MNPLLADYAGQLWPLTQELEAMFTEWLPRLRSALGSTRRPQSRDPAGVPDGVGGLSRRGRWERLLTSEWALAEAVPEEFIRRAAMGEQLFLQLARVVPAASPETRVWVDCGPRQLGGPRLAHLAILVVLKRRSEEAGGSFSWAPLHQPDHFRQSVEPTEVLGCRTHLQADPDLTGSGDRFVIGASCRGAVAIGVRETGGGLEVRVGRSVVELQLPAVGEVARMISRPMRSEMRARVVPRASGDPVQALRFTPGGGVLLVIRAERVEAWAVPRCQRKKSKLRFAEPGWGDPKGVVVAVGWANRRLITLRALDGRLFYIRDTQLEMALPSDFVVAGPARWMCPVWMGWATTLGSRGVLVRDGDGVLWVLDFGCGEGTVLGRSSIDPFVADNVYTWVDPKGACVRLYPGQQDPEVAAVIPGHGIREHPCFDAPNVVVCTPRNAWGSYVGAYVDGVWRVGSLGSWGSPNVTGFESIPSTDPVDGVLIGERGDLQIPTSLITHDECTVCRVHSGGREVLGDFGAGVDHVAVGGRSGTIVAVATRDGWVHFLAQDGELRLSFLPGDE